MRILTLDSSYTRISWHLCHGWHVSRRRLRDVPSIQLVAVDPGQGVPSRNAVTEFRLGRPSAEDRRKETRASQNGQGRESNSGGDMKHVHI